MELSFLRLLQELHNPILDQIMIFITTLGNGGMLWIIIDVILLCFPKTRKCGITLSVALVMMSLIGNVFLKNLFMRNRPCWVDQSVTLLIRNPTDYSFPSGHTFSSFTAAVVLFKYYKKAGIGALVLASLIAFSRLYLFVHYPSDVLGGLVLGIITGLLAYGITNRYKLTVGNKSR